MTRLPAGLYGDQIPAGAKELSPSPKLSYLLWGTPSLLVIEHLDLTATDPRAGIAGSNPAEGMDVCLSVVCCQVEVSATGRSLVQRSPIDCGVSLCVIQ